MPYPMSATRVFETSHYWDDDLERAVKSLPRIELTLSHLYSVCDVLKIKEYVIRFLPTTWSI